jgi:hypothetical protein
MFLKNMLHRLVFALQLILVVLFIVFEEIIWETIAKPIYDYIHELRLLQTIQKKLARVNRYVILALFLVLLVSVEGAGLLAGVMAVRGKVLFGTLLYGAKIPIAAFTFWLFHVTESKLMSFGWFKWSYEQIIAGFDWIKSRQIYHETRELMRQLKERFRTFKQQYFTGDNTIAKRFRRLYRLVKKALSKQ